MMMMVILDFGIVIRERRKMISFGSILFRRINIAYLITNISSLGINIVCLEMYLMMIAGFSS